MARPGEQGKAGGRLASQRGKEALLWQEALGELSRSRGGARGVKQSLLSRRTTPTEPDPCSKRGSSPWLPGLSRRCRASTLRPPPPVVPEEPLKTAPLTVYSEEVGDAIKSFRPGSAPGPYGLRGEYLKEAGV